MNPKDPGVPGSVKITDRGAVVLGGIISCDGHFEDAILHIITHAHSDHTRGLRESIYSTPFIGATPATRDVLEVLGFRIPASKFLPLPYGQPVRIEDVYVTLHQARHIIGAAQVEVETSNLTVGYTGDFKLPGTPILRPDILVIESTYGHPRNVRPFKHEVENLFVDLVMEGLSKGPVSVFGYHGKLQEAMEILREAGLEVPFVAPDKIYRIAKIAEKYGMKIAPLYREGTRDAEEIMRSEWYVYFHHVAGRRKRSLLRGYNIVLSGWEFQEPIRPIDYNTYLVALSDHADFEDLIEYVSESKPKVVIVDGYRSGSPHALAREIERRVGIRALVMP